MTTTPSVKIVEGELTVEEPSKQPTLKVVGEILEEISSPLYDTQDPARICDEELVADPALISDDLKCPLCLDLLKEPALTSCCGQHFCQKCIDNVKAETHICPLCNENKFETFLDKQKQRTVNALKVYCRMRVRGCEWEGELGKLNQHLDICCGDCKFVQVECEFGSAGCMENLLRKDVVKHQQECMEQHLLLMTRFTSKSIKNFEQRLCEQKTIFEQQLLQKDQELEAVYNQLQEINKKLELKVADIQRQLELKDQVIADIQHQLELKDQVIADIQHQLELKDHTTEPDHEVVDTWPASESSKPLKHTDNQDAAVHPSPVIQHITLKSPIQQEVPVVPVEVTMTDFEDYNSTYTEWYSPAFYTHGRGYGLCLSIKRCAANHIFVYVYLMRGEFDDHLQFPFCAYIVAEIVDQKTGENIEEVITFKKQDRVPTPLKRNQDGHRSGFIPLFMLYRKCIVNDCLKLRVTNVTLNLGSQ